MTDIKIKITQLTSGSIVEAADLIPIVSGSATLPETKRVRAEDLFKNVPGGNITASGSITSGGIVTTGNIYTTPWTNYSELSTIVGWASFTTKTIYYKKVGKLVFVQFYLYGTSNSTSTSFTLPYQIAAGPSIETVVIGADNGTWTMARSLRLSSGATVANFYSGLGSAAWTNTGIKAVWGQFWYESV